MEDNKHLFTGKAIVSFSKEIHVKSLLYFHKQRFCIWHRIKRYLNFYGSKLDSHEYDTYRIHSGPNILEVEQASEPTDIYWDNLKFTKKELFWRRLLSNFMTIVLVIVSASIILTMLYL